MRRNSKKEKDDINKKIDEIEKTRLKYNLIGILTLMIIVFIACDIGGCVTAVSRFLSQ